MADETIERDAKGRLLPGSVLNPLGRPSKRKGYLDILRSVCTDAEWGAICDKAIAQAKAGDKNARKFVADYLLGKPVQRVKADIATRSVIDARYTNILNRIYGDGASGSEDEVPPDTG